MPGKIVLFGKKMNEALLEGVEELSSAVESTLGPRGRTVLISPEMEGSIPHITKDGVTVAKSIIFSDEAKNMGASLIKDVASRVNDEAGDGTTTATILAAFLVKEGLKLASLGYNPTLLKNGMDAAVKEACALIEKRAVPIGDNDWDMLKTIASISANNDPSIGGAICDAMKIAGRDGIVTVETGLGSGEMKVRGIEGFQFDKGMLGFMFATDMEKMEASYINPYILIVDDVLSSSRELIEILNWSLSNNRPLVIIANDITGDAIQALILNRVKSNIAVLPIKSPGYGDNRTEMLEDIAILTGGVTVNPKSGMKLSQFQPEWLGTCSKITSAKDNTIILDGKGERTIIDARAAVIRSEISRCDEDWDREQLQKRLAALTGGAAIIEVTASSEVEMREKKDRVDDSIAATKASIEKGIVPGGGTTFLQIKSLLESIIYATRDNLYEKESADFKVGFEAVISCMEEPFKAIMKNGGWGWEAAMQNILKDDSVYDALKKEYIPASSMLIIDPAKVLICALSNAESIASTLITSTCMIINDKKDNMKHDYSYE